jgi:hypothetical protein
LAELLYTQAVVAGTPITEIIAVHRGDDNIIKLHRPNSTGQVLSLGGIGRERFSMSHITEGTSPGADVPKDHEGGCAVIEALTKIWAVRLFADTVQARFSKGAFECSGSLGPRKAGSDPCRL